MMTRHGLLMAGIGLAALAAGAPAASGFQRTVKTSITTYENAPVAVRHGKMQLLQTYSGATQFPMADAEDGTEAKVRRSRVRNVNRLNQLLPTYVLEGDLELRNTGRNTVSAVQVTAVFLNAFRERIGTDQQSIRVEMLPYQARRLHWSRNVQQPDVFEAVFVVTKVRFEDGLVWVPTEELLLLP
ncbi:MAG: hypothetical protein HYY15_01525 [Candidatus Omnitrophica bacterium]|nr:hypothetical protein [Candidatus Omnitrophota bacterium]